ncbi:hypothetical protein [Helicobacter sp. 12S02634-8]|nr:hypothetical protein [Helicobacter sp. 12S02634-8]
MPYENLENLKNLDTNYQSSIQSSDISQLTLKMAFENQGNGLYGLYQIA